MAKTPTKSRSNIPRRKNIASAKRQPKFTKRFNLGLAAVLIGVLVLIGGLYVLLTRATTQDAYTYAGQATKSLDETGKTIPSSGYTVPTTNVIYMSTAGADTNTGTQAAPVATLAKAIALVPTGGTIVVRGGEYRQGNINVNKSLSIIGYPGEQAWFNGADVVASSSWTSDGAGHWYRSWDTPSFCGGKYYNLPYNQQDSNTSTNSGPCTHADNYRDPDFPAAGDPQMVFVNDVHQKEVAALANVTSNTFFYDWANKRIYIGFDPANKTVELAARPSAIILGNQQTYTLKGVGFKKYASNEHESVSTSAAVYIGAYSATVEKVVFKQNAAKGLGFSNPKNGTVVRNSVFAYNGFNGLGANGGTTSGTRNDFVVEGNIFNYNNVEGYGKNCTLSCSASAIKFGHMYGFTIKNNIFENGQTVSGGFWCDIDCREGKMVNNVAHNNGGAAIFYEISNNGIIAGNLIYDNGEVGIRVASDNTKVYNNTIVNATRHDIWIYDDNRDGGTTGVSGSLGPNTQNVTVANNILYGPSATTFKASGKQTMPTTYLTSDYNSFYRPTTSQFLYNIMINGTETFFKSLSALRVSQPKLEANSRDITDGSNPFTDMVNKNYIIRSNAAEYNASTPIPSDVAAAMGVAAGATPSLGAVYPNLATTTITSTVTPPPTTTVTTTVTPPPAPTIQVIGLTSGATVTDTLNVEAKVSGATTISRVEFYIDGVLAASEGIAPYCMGGDTGGVCDQYSLASVAAGSHTLKISVKDATTEIATTSLSFNKLAPTTTITPSTPPPPPADTQAPTAPSNVKATINYDALRFSYFTNLTWSASTDNVGVKNYLVKRNGSPLGTPTATSFSDYTLQANNYYTYEVFAQDAAGNTSTAGTARLIGRCFLIWCWAE